MDEGLRDEEGTWDEALVSLSWKGNREVIVLIAIYDAKRDKGEAYQVKRWFRYN